MPKSLLVGVDEFTVVLRVKSPVDAKYWLTVADDFIQEFIEKSKIKELFYSLVPMTSKLPAGYTEGLTVENVTWYFAIAVHEHYQEMGVCIRFSAEAWAWYQKQYMEEYGKPMNIAIFFQLIQSVNYIARISRIDLTADYFNYGKELKPDTIFGKLIDRKVIVLDCNERAANRKLTHYGSGGFVETIVIGSKKENTKSLCRIYDKRLEQISKSGFRLEEALACDEWTRFEISYRGSYAWQVGDGLLNIKDDIELSRYIAAKITDKYRFYIVEDEDYTLYTIDLLDIVNNNSFCALRSENPKNNSLRDSISHLIKGSGLFPTLYKVGSIWGDDAEIELLKYLYSVYKTTYKPEAYKDRKLVHWIRENYGSLHNQKFEDSLLIYDAQKGGGDNEIRSPDLGKGELDT